jgi:chromosomal replication initiation ATPase DnaA
MAEALKKEREKLFAKSKPSKVIKRANRAFDETPTASYFSTSAERFRSRYKHTHKTTHDLQMVLIFLAQQFDVDVDAVLSKSRKMPLPMVRKYYSFFTYYYFMQTQQKIAELINRERSTVATSIQYAINDLECYARSREIAYKVDKFIHDISDRRKHEI